MQSVKAVILGCGGFSGAHARRLSRRDDVQIVGLCDVATDICENYIDKHLSEYGTRPEIFTNAAEMYQKLEPDAVFICTPHTLHFDHAMQALDHGLHTFIEKPMVTNAGHAHELKAKADATGKIVVVGYNSSCTPEINHIRQIIRDGSLGRLEMVVGHLSQNWREATRGKWRQDPAISGGGQAYDSGAHLLNTLVWTVEQDIEEVFALIDNMDTKVDINSSINVKFAGGVFASIVISGNCPVMGNHMSFIFDGGKINVDGWSGTWIEVFKGKDRVKYPRIEGEPQTPDDNFIEAIQGKQEPATSPTNGIVQSELMDAIYESAKTGQPARPKRG